MSECITRRLYKLSSRNLSLGVYDGKEGFIGIRQKFGNGFLFTEFHWDQGPPYGTVDGVEDTGIDLPEHIELKEHINPTEHTFSTYMPLMEWLDEKANELG